MVRYIGPIYRTSQSNGRHPMLELAILGLLKERSMHGYQLSKRLTDALGGFWRVSYGSLYPTPPPLQAQGAVERRFAERSARHEQGSDRDRRRRQLCVVARAGPRVLQGRG